MEKAVRRMTTRMMQDGISERGLEARSAISS